MSKPHHPPAAEIFTGCRPTGTLTIANYLGAIKPLLELQETGKQILIFIADLHGLTDQEADVVAANRFDVAADYLALGLNPTTSKMFMQSAIKEQVLFFTLLLSKHFTLSELMRVPTLKDKLKDPEHPEQASVLLATYPLMMAADILLQRAQTVPVGDDQVPHLEVTRVLARRFNAHYGLDLVEPRPHIVKPLRITSLTGEGKMSKSKPSGAILLHEDIDSARQKIMRAATAVEGEMSDALASHFLICESLGTPEQKEQLAEIKKQHLGGSKVMGDFKKLFADIVCDFLADFQKKHAAAAGDKKALASYLEEGNEIARHHADAVIAEVEKALKFN